MVGRTTITWEEEELLNMDQYEFIRTAHRVYGRNISELSKMTGEIVMDHVILHINTSLRHLGTIRPRPAYRPHVAWSTCLYRYGALLNSYDHGLCRHSAC